MSKVVLITGASAGIGKETAKQLQQAGYSVYGAARRIEKMSDLQALGVNVIDMDVTNEESMTAGVKQILEAEGSIDVLINNAGFGSYGAFEEVSMADAKYQMEVNVFGAARLTQLTLPSMIKNNYGKIVNISSIGGKIASALGGWYHASKFALEALSDSLRNEVKQFGVDVIVIEPGGIKSEWAGIAAENLLKLSGHGKYKSMAERLANMFKGDVDAASPEPKIIADLILAAITSEEPETRYVAGFMAKEMLEMRKTTSDRDLDKMLHSQLNIK
jgi:short-subunit dehydrogenase